MTTERKCSNCRWRTDIITGKHCGCDTQRKKLGAYSERCSYPFLKEWEPILKEGDKVWVRDDIALSKRDEDDDSVFDYTPCCFPRELDKYIGTELTIKKLDPSKMVVSKGYHWHQSWLTYKKPEFIIDHSSGPTDNKLENLTWTGFGLDGPLNYNYQVNLNKTTLDDAFLSKFKTEDIAINCETEDEAKVLCNWMHSGGLEWNDGFSYLNETNWVSYQEETCYTGKGMFGTKAGSYPNWEIIKFKDCVIPKKLFISVPWGEGPSTAQVNPLTMNNTKLFSDLPIASEIYTSCLKGSSLDIDNYQLISPISAIDIADKNPCVGEYLKFIEEIDGYYGLNEKFDWNVLKSFEAINDNLDWLLEKGSIKKVEKEFEPFDMTFRIESEKDLKSLWEALYKITGVESTDNYEWKTHDCTMYWDQVDGKVSEFSLKDKKG